MSDTLKARLVSLAMPLCGLTAIIIAAGIEHFRYYWYAPVSEIVLFAGAIPMLIAMVKIQDPVTIRYHLDSRTEEIWIVATLFWVSCIVFYITVELMVNSEIYPRY